MREELPEKEGKHWLAVDLREELPEKEGKHWLAGRPALGPEQKE
jgi:hypothetical protein